MIDHELMRIHLSAAVPLRIWHVRLQPHDSIMAGWRVEP